MIGGVAGGLGDYLDVDPTIVRLVLVLTALMSGGFVLIAYLALWIIMPEASSSTLPGLTTLSGTAAATSEPRGANGALILGVILVAVGGIALLDQLPMLHLFGWGMARLWWPSLLIAVGVALVLARARD
jgi:phage shock protein PspC (stress-responsive transcriptional regulator)